MICNYHQMMELFPLDIIDLIFFLCSISSKRSFIRTCHRFSKYSTLMPKFEKEFQKMIVKTKFFHKYNFTSFSNPLYKFTIELVYDNCLIPDTYIIPENRIIHEYPKLYYRIGLQGNLGMIQKILDNKPINVCHTMRGAAQGGHKHILEWMEKKWVQI